MRLASWIYKLAPQVVAVWHSAPETKKINIQNESKEKYDEVPLWWAKEAPCLLLSHQILCTRSYNQFYKGTWDRLHADIFECLLSQLEGLQATRVAEQAVTLFGNPALYHDHLVLLLQCTPTEVMINSGELHCLWGKTNSHRSLSTSTKALGGFILWIWVWKT